MPTALFFRPNSNTALAHGSRWLSDGKRRAESRGYDIIDLWMGDCTFSNLKAALENNDVDCAFLLGHGSPTVFTGRTVGGTQELVFRVCSGDEIMNGTITHFCSCLVGQELLPDAINKGMTYTIGYNDTFDFMIYPEEAEEPFHDITVTIITSILDGATLKQAWDDGIAKGEEWIDQLFNRGESWVSDCISLIEHDINCMVGLGDEAAYVRPAPTKMRVAPILVFGGIAWGASLLVMKGVGSAK